MSFFDKYMRSSEPVNEEADYDEYEDDEDGFPSLSETDSGYVITYTLYMIAQAHTWHLLCPSGQKHVALQYLYEELQSEVDELAERFLAVGGSLENVTKTIVSDYSEELILSELSIFRGLVTNCISSLSRPEYLSIKDGFGDLQEVLDNAVYKFNLE